MSDPDIGKQLSFNTGNLQYANPFRNDDDSGYKVEEYNCVYLGNNKFWMAELKQERKLNGEFEFLLKDMEIGHSFVLQHKTKSGSIIIGIKQ